MPQENLKKVYESASKYYSLPDFDTFSKDMQDEANLKTFYQNVGKHYSLPEFNQFKSDMSIIPTNGYQWSSQNQQSSYKINQPSQADIQRDLPNVVIAKKQEAVDKYSEQEWGGGATSNYDKTDDVLLKAAKIQTGVTDKQLEQEAEYGMNRSFYGNTQRVVNNTINSKNILESPKTTPEELKEDLKLKSSSILSSIETLRENKQTEIDDLYKSLTPDEVNLGLAKNKEKEILKKYEKQEQDLLQTLSEVKDIYLSDKQREKLNPVVNLYKQDPSSIYKLSPQQFDKLTSDYGAFLTYAENEELENLYLKSRDFSNLDFDLAERMGYEAQESGSVIAGVARGIVNKPIPKETVQKVDRLGVLSTLDDLSNLAMNQTKELNAKYEDINKRVKEASTKEEINELKAEWESLAPEKDKIKQLTDFIKLKSQETTLKFKDLKEKEDYQKEIDYFDNLSQNSLGFNWAIKEEVNNLLPKFTGGLKNLIRLTEDPENQKLHIFEDVENYKANTFQIPTYYKNTPALERDSNSLLGVKLNSSAWYTIGKVTAQSLELAAISTLTGGSSLASQAGWTSLRGVLSGAGAASTIVLPTMISTSMESTAQYLDQGFSPDVANKLGILTGFIEGLTEVVNPIEVGASLKLTQFTDKISSKAVKQALLNNVYKQVTGKLPSNKLVRLLTATPEFLGEIGKQFVLESIEEELGLFFNSFKNEWAKEQKPDYVISEDEELNLTNVLMTAANTMVSMPLLGLMGAGVSMYQQKNSALPTARFIIAQKSDIYSKQLEQDFKDKKIPKEVYEAAKEEIPKLQANYLTHKSTIDNLPEEDAQIRFFNLTIEQQDLTKQLLAKPNDEELSNKIDTINIQITFYQQEALLNAAKTPQEKAKVVEKVILDAIEKTYTPEFIKTVSPEAAKKDLLNRSKFIKSPKVDAKIEEIISQIANKETKEQEVKEVEEQDNQYLQQKNNEKLLQSIVLKVQNNLELTEEESQFIDDNQELVTQELSKLTQEPEQQDFSTQEETEESFVKQQPTQEIAIPSEEIETKKADIERRRYEALNAKDKQSGELKRNMDNDILEKRRIIQQFIDNKGENLETIEGWNDLRGDIQELLFEGKFEEAKAKVPKTYEEKINAKYDAELAALGQQEQKPEKETKSNKAVEQTTNVIPVSNLTLEQERQLLEQTEDDVNKLNKFSENQIAKLTAIEEEIPEENDSFLFKLLVTAYDKIAYQARKFTETKQGKVNVDDSLNPEYSFLNSPEIGEGHELIFQLSEYSNYTSQAIEQFKENKLRLLELGVLSEKEFNEYLSDLNNFVQITIIDKEGRNFGNLHTLDYVRESRVASQLGDDIQAYGDNLKLNLQQLSKTRKEIINQLKEGKQVKAKITYKSIGTLSTKSDNKYISIKDAFRNKDVLNTFTVVIKPEEVISGNKPSVNQKALSNMIGNPVVLLPTPQGNNFALGLKKKTLGNQLAKSAINALNFFLEYNQALLSGNTQRLIELEQINNQIIDKLGNEYDITDFEGLKKYISLFVYNNARTSSFTSIDSRKQRKDVPFIDFDTKDRSIVFSNKRSFASKEDTEELTSLEKLQQVGIFKQYLFKRDGSVNEKNNLFLQNFERFLSERSVNIDTNLLQNTQEFELPVLSEDYSFIENPKLPSYKEFVLNNLETNILEHEITSPSNKKEFSYFQQPTISFELEKPTKEKKKSKTQLYKESTEFKTKIEGFTPILNEKGNEYYYKLENEKITILNTKGNVMKPSNKNYLPILEKVLNLSYEKLEPAIQTFNRFSIDLAQISQDSTLSKENTKEWYIAENVGKIHFIHQYEGKSFGSEMFAEIRDMLDLPKTVGEDFYKIAKKTKQIYRTWLTNNQNIGRSIDSYEEQLSDYGVSMQDIADFIFQYPNGAKDYYNYSVKDMETKHLLNWMYNVFGINIKPVSLLKFESVFYDVEFERNKKDIVPVEDIELTLEELEEIKKEAEVNFTNEEEFKYITELNLSQEYQESLKQQIDYENEQTNADKLDDSAEKISEEASESEEDDDFLNSFKSSSEDAPEDAPDINKDDINDLPPCP